MKLSIRFLSWSVVRFGGGTASRVLVLGPFAGRPHHLGIFRNLLRRVSDPDFGMNSGTELGGRWKEAIVAFAKAHSFLRSIHYPCSCDRVGDSFILKDVPPRKNPRKTEIITLSSDPSSVRGLVDGWHFVTVASQLDADATRIKNAYKSGGYRALSSEGVFLHDLVDAAGPVPSGLVREVTAENFEQINQAAGQKRKLVDGVRRFAIWDEERDYGWVSSLNVDGIGYVSDLYVYAELRGRGYGTELMRALVAAQKPEGVRFSVCIASSAGARIYPRIGFVEVGRLQIFCPIERG